METINVLKKNFDEAQHAYDAVKYRANRTHKAQKDSAKAARDLAHSEYQKALDDYTSTSNGNEPQPVQAVPPSNPITEYMAHTSQSVNEPALNVAPKLLEHEDGGLIEHIKPTSGALDPTIKDISITSETKLREQENAPDREHITDIEADKSSKTTAIIDGFDDKAIDVEKTSASTACIHGPPASLPDEVATNSALLASLNESIVMPSNGGTMNLAQDIAKSYQNEHHRIDVSEGRTYDQSLSEDKLREIENTNEGPQIPKWTRADDQQFDKRNSTIMNVGNPGTEVIEYQSSRQSPESTVYNIVSNVLFNKADTSSSGGPQEAVTPSTLQLPVPVPQGCSQNIMPHVSDEMSTGDTARFTDPHALLDPLANSFDAHHSSVIHQAQTTGNDFTGIDNYGTSFGFEMDMLQQSGSELGPFGVDQVYSFRDNSQHGTMGTTVNMFAPDATQDQSGSPVGLPYSPQARYPIQSSNYLATLISGMSTSLMDNPKLAKAQHRIHTLKEDISKLECSIVNQQDEWEKLENSFRDGSHGMDLGTFVSRTASLQAKIKTAKVDVEMKSLDLKFVEQEFNQLLEYEKNVELKFAIASKLSDIQSKLNGPELPYELYMELCRQRKAFEFHMADINHKVLQSTPEGQNDNQSGNGSSKKRKCTEDAEMDGEIDPDKADVVIDDERSSRKKAKASQKRKIPKKEPKDDDDDDLEPDGDRNDDVQSGRMPPKRIKELAGKVKAKERELAKPRKAKKEEGSSKVVEKPQVTATHEEESPILGLTAKEFEEITQEGRAQLIDFLRTGDLDKLNPSIRRLARRYQEFLPESSFQNEHLAFSMHYTAQNSYVCRFHAENRAHKEYDGSGNNLIEGVGYKPDLQAEGRPKGHMNCGCSIDDVILEFYFWKVLKIRSSNPNLAGVEEGMKDLMLSTRARAFFCAAFRNYSRLTFDDLCNAAKSGASHMTQLAKIQIERLVTEVRGSGQ